MKTWTRRNNNTKAWQTRKERYGAIGSKNPARLLAHLRSNGKKGRAICLQRNLNAQRDAGRNSRKDENLVASKIEADHVFLPSEVCDRIVIRNGEIFFVEIKKNGQKLRPKQELFRSIAEEKYEVIFA